MVNVIRMMRGVSCTNIHFSRIKGSKVIETLMLIKLLFITISTSVPVVIILLLMVHMAAIDSHWGRIIKIKNTIAQP